MLRLQPTGHRLLGLTLGLGFAATLTLLMGAGDPPPFSAKAQAEQQLDGIASTPRRGLGRKSPLPQPTLGGRQLWIDRHFRAGWRIQQHVWTGHFRLLDSANRRHAWGSEDFVTAVFDEIRATQKLKPSSPHLVVLLHGWGRTGSMFSDLDKALRAAGYEVARLSYPSTRGNLEQHAEDLTRFLDSLEGYRQVSFVTHSLGAMVLRRMLAESPAFSNGITLHRAVLMAPPNQGAELARRLHGFPPFDLIGGPVGADLLPSAVGKLPPPNIPFAIVAGARNSAEGWNPLVPGDDDGVVSLQETRLPGAQAFVVVPTIHTFIASHPQSIAAALAFLRRPVPTKAYSDQQQRL